MEGGPEGPRINILINLTSRLLCEALQALLEKEMEIYHSVVADNMHLNHGFTPDKILVDVNSLKQSIPAVWDDAKIVLVDTGLPEEELVRLFSTHRLEGVISTDTDAALFHKALRVIHAGEVWMDHSKLKALLHNQPPPVKSTVLDSFSRKEREIVLLVAEGRKNREIAEHLNISEQTVKTHLSSIFKKADVTSRVQLAPLALKFSAVIPQDAPI